MILDGERTAIDHDVTDVDVAHVIMEKPVDFLSADVLDVYVPPTIALVMPGSVQGKQMIVCRSIEADDRKIAGAVVTEVTSVVGTAVAVVDIACGCCP